ncbi:MAG: hypothetical protein GEV10_31740 [Streptosporangiales bacterium]|nr:hypothetical protein [Streptosporangiales bacterium]
MDDQRNDGDKALEQRRIVTGAGSTAKILYVGSALALLVVIAKLATQGATLTLGGAVSIPLTGSWIVFVLLTVGHVFSAVFLTRRISAYLDLLPSAVELRQVFDELTAGSNPFMHGLVSRARPRRAGGVYHPMSRSDPSAWAAYGATAALVAAMLPVHRGTNGLEWEDGFTFGALVSLTAVVLIANWWAGSIWLVGLSTLRSTYEEIVALPEGPLTHLELASLLMPDLPSVRTCGQLHKLSNRYWRLSRHPVPLADPDAGHPATHLSTKQLWYITSGYRHIRECHPQLGLPEIPPFQYLLDGLPPAPERDRGAGRSWKDRPKERWWRRIS